MASIPYDLTSSDIAWWGGPTVAGAEMRAAWHRDRAMHMQRLWAHWMGGRHSYVFPKIDVAPVARISAVETATDFVMEDTSNTYDPELEIPWSMQKGYDKIHATVAIATPSFPLGLGIRLQSQPLVSAVAAASGGWSLSGSTSKLGEMGDLADNGYGWVFGYRCTLEPTLPADRRIAIRVQASLKIIGDDPLGLTFVQPRIVGLRLSDGIVTIGG